MIRVVACLALVVATVGCADALNAVKAETTPQTTETSSATVAEATPPPAPEPAPVPEPQPNPELRKGLQCLDFKPFDLQLGGPRT